MIHLEKLKKTSPPDYIKIALKLTVGWFSMQVCRTDTTGKELTRIIDVTDDDIATHNPTLNEIKFVHEIYFSLCTQSGRRLKVRFDANKWGI